MNQDDNTNSSIPRSDFPEYHKPVLLQETIELLAPAGNQVIVDCTFGGGGHSKAILSHLGEGGRLIAFDQDDSARQNLPDDPRVIFVPHNFRHLQRFLRLHGLNQVDGILADLGVSSHQFDVGDRGFSTRFEGALDMRMDRRQSLTAAEVVNNYPEEKLHHLFQEYGEVTNSKTLARTLVAYRKTARIESTQSLKHAISGIVKGNPNKYFAQVFQALRIEVNDEMGALVELLEQVPPLLLPGGRIAIITFHSIEDRLVKHFFRHGQFGEKQDNPFTMDDTSSPFRLVNKKPVTAKENETRLNPRARSAKLRVAEKI